MDKDLNVLIFIIDLMTFILLAISIHNIRKFARDDPKAVPVWSFVLLSMIFLLIFVGSDLVEYGLTNSRLGELMDNLKDPLLTAASAFIISAVYVLNKTVRALDKI